MSGLENVQTRKKRTGNLAVLTWSLAGRCCWAPSCPVTAQTPVWWVHLQFQEPGRGWGCAPLSGCSCSGCWLTDGIGCGGCVEGAAEAVAWTDCGLRALKEKKGEQKQQLHFRFLSFSFFCWDDSKRMNPTSHAFSNRIEMFKIWYLILNKWSTAWLWGEFQPHRHMKTSSSLSHVTSHFPYFLHLPFLFPLLSPFPSFVFHFLCHV